MRGSQTIVVLVAPQVADGYGNQALDWTAAVEHEVPGCSVQPEEGVEVTINRQVVVDRWRLFAPPGTVLTSADRVRHEGTVYEVDGTVQRWGTGSRGYVTCRLKEA